MKKKKKAISIDDLAVLLILLLWSPLFPFRNRKKKTRFRTRLEFHFVEMAR